MPKGEKFKGKKPINGFTSELNPMKDPEIAAKAGQTLRENTKKKHLIRDLLNSSLSNPIAFQNKIKIASECLGILPDQLTFGLMMDLVQITKAILEGDTKSYLAVMRTAGEIGEYKRSSDELEHFEINGNRICIDGKHVEKQGNKVAFKIDFSNVL